MAEIVWRKEDGGGGDPGLATWPTDDPLRRLQVRPVASCKLPSWQVTAPKRQSIMRPSGERECEADGAGEMELELEPVPTIAGSQAGSVFVAVVFLYQC